MKGFSLKEKTRILLLCFLAKKPFTCFISKQSKPIFGLDCFFMQKETIFLYNFPLFI